MSCRGRRVALRGVDHLIFGGDICKRWPHTKNVDEIMEVESMMVVSLVLMARKARVVREATLTILMYTSRLL